MRDEASALHGAPWWARLSVMFGGPTLICLLVLYGVYSIVNGAATRLANSMDVTQDILTRHTTETASLIAIQQSLVNVVRANCVNNARDDEGVRRCMQ